MDDIAYAVPIQVLAAISRRTEVAIIVANNAIVPLIRTIVINVVFVVMIEVILENDISDGVEEHNPEPQIVTGSGPCDSIVVASNYEYTIGVVAGIVVLDVIVVR